MQILTILEIFLSDKFFFIAPQKGYISFLPEVMTSSVILIYLILKITKCDNYKNFILIFILSNTISSYFLFNSIKNSNFGQFFNFIYSSDLFTNFFKFFTILLVSFVLFFSLIREFIEINETQKTTSKNTEFIILIAFGLLLFLIIITSNDLFLTYITIEGLSLLVSILIIGYGPIFKSTEAAIKYFSISAFTAGFVLYGISVIYKNIQTTNYTEIKKYLFLSFENNNTSNLTWLIITLLFILLGFFFKLTVAPFHLWATEVYGNVPIVTASFIFLPYKFSILIAMFKILTQCFYSLNWVWGPILLILSISSIFWGSIGALYEDKIKKFLVFASINQTGFILLGFGTMTFYGISASLMHLSFYFLSMIALFLYIIVAKVYNLELKISYIHQLQYLKLPLFYRILLVPLLFSMMGFPPFFGFFTKYFLLLETLNSVGLFFMLLVLILNIISSFYYFRLIKNIFFFTESEIETSKIKINNTGIYITSSIFFILIVTIISVSWVYIGDIVIICDHFSKSLIYPNVI